MSNLVENENLKYQLETLSQYEPDDLDSPEFDVAYETEFGVEGMAIVCCIDLAARSFARIKELEAALSEQEAGIWKWCPECGCENSKPTGFDDGRFCSKCGQEWFTSLDYSDVVRRNLVDLTTSLAHPQPQNGETPQSVEEFIAKKAEEFISPFAGEENQVCIRVLDFMDFMAGKSLVPVEPTVEMLAALAFDGDVDIAIGHAAILKETEDGYKAMLEAAKGE